MVTFALPSGSEHQTDIIKEGGWLLVSALRFPSFQIILTKINFYSGTETTGNPSAEGYLLMMKWFPCFYSRRCPRDCIRRDWVKGNWDSLVWVPPFRKGFILWFLWSVFVLDHTSQQHNPQHFPQLELFRSLRGASRSHALGLTLAFICRFQLNNV